MTYTLSDFDFDLPSELIAQFPLERRTSSRLLHVDGDKFIDRHFDEIAGLFKPDDLLVFNNTRVLKARLFGAKASGGKIEVLVERILDDKKTLTQVRASKSPKNDSILRLADSFDVKVIGRDNEFYILEFPSSVAELLEKYGKMPLPPYIERSADNFDETRYQTVYARELGAVAAPTAGLHFDDALLEKLRNCGVRTAEVTLHVGAGTFQPVRTENISEHKMHSERYFIPQKTVDEVAAAKEKGRDVIAVGTTSLRALEAASQNGVLRGGSSETALFITPGYEFRIVSRLITNFHLPKSTLLMLVSAFAGFDEIRRAYDYAVAQKYRFFSYGDAMLLTKKDFTGK